MVTAALPAVAQASWAQPVRLAGSDALGGPHVGIDASGDAVFAWSRYHQGTGYQTVARRSTAGGTVSATHVIATGFGAFDMGVDASGDAVFTWLAGGGSGHPVKARTFAADGTVGPAQTVWEDTRRSERPQVAVNATGDAVIAWRSYDGSDWRIRARMRASDGSLGPLRTLSSAGRDAFGPWVGIDAQGDAVVAWSRGRAQARTLSADSIPGPIQTLSTQFAPSLELSVNPTGATAIGWRVANGTGERFEAVTRSADGDFGPVRTLSPGTSAIANDLSVDAGGNALAAWEDDSDDRIRLRTLAPDGTLGPVQIITPSPQTASEARLGVDASGDTVIAWLGHQQDPSTQPRVWARTRTHAGHLSPVEAVSPGNEKALPPQLAVNAQGRAALVWNNDPFHWVEGSLGP
jgi:hypothetical protein